MRKLNTADVFAMARIVRASGVREELRNLIQRVSGDSNSGEDGGEDSMASIGIEGFLVIMEALAERKSEHAIYETLAGPFEMTADEVAMLELDSLESKLAQLAAENNLKRFFDLVSRILGKR